MSLLRTRAIRHPFRAAGTLATIGVVGAAYFGGAFATFTSTATAGPQTISSGTMVIAAGPANDVATGAANIAAGDTVVRKLDINSTGATINAASITLKFSASPSSLLDTDVTNGLQLSISECSSAWTGTYPSYACGGTTTAITINALATIPVSTVVGTAEPLATMLALSPNQTDHLRITLTLPSTSPGDTSKVAVCSGTPGGSVTTEDLQGCTSTLTYSFVATQRAGAPQ